jgi:predicted small lipoprotein YifL
MQHKEWIQLASTAAVAVILGVLGGCHQKAPPTATAADVAAAQQEAQHEVEQAKLEAKKDIKSETKIMGADSKGVARARVTGAFDIAMAHADGDRQVAIQKCLMLEPSAQQSCKDNAEADYQAAAAKAKANRASAQ